MIPAESGCKKISKCHPVTEQAANSVEPAAPNLQTSYHLFLQRYSVKYYLQLTDIP